MNLRLEAVAKFVAAETHLYPLDLSFAAGTMNVVLGKTLAGKTTLLRIIAGLDRPSAGRVVVDGKDVAGVSVRERNLSMVYQQFVNYPSLSVYENIASPLRLKRRAREEIRTRVGAIAEVLRLTPFLDRLPAELSGGQQQRVALARALAKEAELLLLDEPLVNLDYKLREELRAELSELFRDRNTTIVYATTEPQEALQLGGSIAILEAGRLLQSGETPAAFRRPASLAAAKAFSDPPLNVFAASSIASERLGAAQVLAVRAHDLKLTRQDDDLAFTGRVTLAEISGSETYLHLDCNERPLVAQLAGVQQFSIDDECTLYAGRADIFGFDATGKSVAVTL